MYKVPDIMGKKSRECSTFLCILSTMNFAVLFTVWDDYLYFSVNKYIWVLSIECFFSSDFGIMLGTFVWVIRLIFMLLYGVDICERDNLTYEFDNKERRKEQIFGLDPDIYKPLSCILGMNIATTGLYTLFQFERPWGLWAWESSSFCITYYLSNIKILTQSRWNLLCC